jgi:hypothetical protein
MQIGTVYLYIILMALWLKWMTLLAWTEMLMVPALRTQPFFVLNNVTISHPSRSFVGIGQIKHTLSHHAPTRAHFNPKRQFVSFSFCFRGERQQMFKLGMKGSILAPGLLNLYRCGLG